MTQEAVRLPLGRIVEPMIQWDRGDGERTVPLARELFRDEESLSAWPSIDVLSAVFGDDPQEHAADKGSLAPLLAVMDSRGIDVGQVALPPEAADDATVAEVLKHDGRIIVSARLNPHEGMEAVRGLRRMIDSGLPVRSVSIGPSLVYPTVPPNDKVFYPIYTTCVETGLPIMLNVGFPGPRVPSAAQDPTVLDEVLWFFPDLTVIMKHGGDPWTRVCYKLLEKWPNAYYATTAMAPHRYPKEIMALLNSRTKAHKILFAGYWPLIGYDKIFSGIQSLGFDEAAVERFMSANARKVFGILFRTAPTVRVERGGLHEDRPCSAADGDNRRLWRRA